MMNSEYYSDPDLNTDSGSELQGDILYNMWDSASHSNSEESNTDYHSIEEDGPDSDSDLPGLNEPTSDDYSSESDSIPSLMEVTDDEVENYCAHLEVIREYRVENVSGTGFESSTIGMAGIRVMHDNVESINAIMDVSAAPLP